MRGGDLLTFGHRIKGQGQVWHAACETLWAWYRLMFAQLLSNFTCKLLMMRGVTLLILSHPIKGLGQLWDSACETVLAVYRLKFLPDHFWISYVSCWWWEERPYSLCVMTFKNVIQTSYVSCRWWEKRPYSFWVMPLNVVVNFCPLRGDVTLCVV